MVCGTRYVVWYSLFFSVFFHVSYTTGALAVPFFYGTSRLFVCMRVCLVYDIILIIR